MKSNKAVKSNHCHGVKRMSRNSIGIEISEEYYSMVKDQLEEKTLVLFEPESTYERVKYK